jgi:hypothetical protein
VVTLFHVLERLDFAASFSLLLGVNELPAWLTSVPSMLLRHEERVLRCDMEEDMSPGASHIMTKIKGCVKIMMLGATVRLMITTFLFVVVTCSLPLSLCCPGPGTA